MSNALIAEGTTNEETDEGTVVVWFVFEDLDELKEILLEFRVLKAFETLDGKASNLCVWETRVEEFHRVVMMQRSPVGEKTMHLKNGIAISLWNGRNKLWKTLWIVHANVSSLPDHVAIFSGERIERILARENLDLGKRLKQFKAVFTEHFPRTGFEISRRIIRKDDGQLKLFKRDIENRRHGGRVLNACSDGIRLCIGPHVERLNAGQEFVLIVDELTIDPSDGDITLAIGRDLVTVCGKECEADACCARNVCCTDSEDQPLIPTGIWIDGRCKGDVEIIEKFTTMIEACCDVKVRITSALGV